MSGAILPSRIGERAAMGTVVTKFNLPSALQRLQLTRLTAFLLLLSVIFAYSLLYASFAPLQQFAVPKFTPPKRPSPPSIAKFVSPPISDFAAIDERPMFMRTRRPLPIPAKDAPAQQQPPNFALVGVIIDPANRIAITKAPGATESVDLIQGQTVAGWEVTDIEADRIRLRSASTTYELKLQPPSGTAPASTPSLNSGITTAQQFPPSAASH